ncbi:MAG: hypothetical protein LC808_04495 [Actinobacteria bacterium]|nr:hypothetical protein [Actinomycetota bacterium]
MKTERGAVADAPPEISRHQATDPGQRNPGSKTVEVAARQLGVVEVALHEAAHATVLLSAGERFTEIRLRETANGGCAGKVVELCGLPWPMLVTLVAGAVADVGLRAAQRDPEAVLRHFTHDPCCSSDLNQAVEFARELKLTRSVAQETIAMAIKVLDACEGRWLSLTYALCNSETRRAPGGPRQKVLRYEFPDGPRIAGYSWTDAVSVWAHPAVEIKPTRQPEPGGGGR